MKHKLHILFIFTFVLMSLAPLAVAQAKPPLHVGLVLEGYLSANPASYDGMAIQGLELEEVRRDRRGFPV